MASYGSVDSCGAQVRATLNLDERYLPSEPFERWTGMDLDVAFAYPTTKVLRIRDARLGCLRVCLTLMVALYVIVWELWNQGGYLQDDVPMGTVTFMLRQRGSTCPNEEMNRTDCSECRVDTSDDDCFDEWAPVQTLDYCTQSNFTYDGREYECRQQEYTEVEKVEDLSLFCTTLASAQTQTKVCSTVEDDPLYKGGDCDNVYATNSTDTYYIADIESFIVFVKHTFRASSIGITGNSHSNKGRLKVKSGDVCDRSRRPKSYLRHGKATHDDFCYVQLNHTYSDLDNTGDVYDEIDLSLLLASDFDFHLDRWNGRDNSTYRETGVHIKVYIRYYNFFPWTWTVKTLYTYEAVHEPGSSSVTEDEYYDNYPNDLTILQRAGVKLDFVQDGTLYTFDLTQALIRITTAFALFAVISYVVDYLALYCFRHRHLYDKYKYEMTEDFGDIVDNEAVVKF